MTSKLRRTGPAAPSAPPSLLPLWGLHSRPRTPFTPHPPHPSLPLPTGRRCPPPPSRLSAAAIPSGRLPGLPNPGSGCVPSHCAPTLVHSVASPQRGHSCAAFQLEPWFWLGGLCLQGTLAMSVTLLIVMTGRCCWSLVGGGHRNCLVSYVQGQPLPAGNDLPQVSTVPLGF